MVVVMVGVGWAVVVVVVVGRFVLAKQLRRQSVTFDHCYVYSHNCRSFTVFTTIITFNTPHHPHHHYLPDPPLTPSLPTPVSQLVSFVFDGGRASCFAYGQTGSGKTFTMMGSQPDLPSQDDENAGLYVLAARDIFAKLSQYVHRSLEVHVSCFEIYGGKLFDLLNDRQPVKCLEDAKQQVQLPGLSEHVVYGVGDVLELMARGHAQRSTGGYDDNVLSSF